MKISIWWNIPCKSIVPVARELANIKGIDVTFISQTGLSQSRRDLGWGEPVFGNAEYVILPELNWKNSVRKLVLDKHDIHIFNGVYFFPKIRYALDFARKNNCPYGVISEAPHNPYSGYKRILKKIFTSVVTPFRVSPRVNNAKFLLGASGSDFQPFLNLGWKKSQFFPYGYFPDNSNLKPKQLMNNEIPHLLCTGIISKNKGQHILLKALAILKSAHIAFYCTITGYGPEEKTIRQLANDLNIDDCVDFAGVISDSELNEIKQKVDLLIAPGLEEPWGIRINEALLANTPVIVSDKIGACELIRTSGAGRLFESGNVNSLVAELKVQLEHDALDVSKARAREFSVKITPLSAASYLLSVVEYTLYNVGERPYPIWLHDK